MMPQAAYAIGVLTSILCAFLLILELLGAANGVAALVQPLLRGLAVNNVILFADLFVVPDSV